MYVTLPANTYTPDLTVPTHHHHTAHISNSYSKYLANERQINWDKVASNPLNNNEITNGHAARMRYSRFKKQMDSTQNSSSPAPASAPRKPRTPKLDGAVRKNGSRVEKNRSPKKEKKGGLVKVEGRVKHEDEGCRQGTVESSARGTPELDHQNGRNQDFGLGLGLSPTMGMGNGMHLSPHRDHANMSFIPESAAVVQVKRERKGSAQMSYYQPALPHHQNGGHVLPAQEYANSTSNSNSVTTGTTEANTPLRMCVEHSPSPEAESFSYTGHDVGEIGEMDEYVSSFGIEGQYGTPLLGEFGMALQGSFGEGFDGFWGEQQQGGLGHGGQGVGVKKEERWEEGYRVV